MLGVADTALELAELAEIGGDAVTDPADHRHVDDHAERRDARGAAGHRPKLSVLIVPAVQHVAALADDVDGALAEEFLHGHGTASRKTRGRNTFAR